MIPDEPRPAHPPGTQILYHAGFTDERGWYHLEAGEGRYRVRICKGPEWAMSDFDVVAIANDAESVRNDITLNRLYDLKSLGWFSGDLHHHSLHSDGWQRIDDIHAAALAMDCDFLALTDHNTVASITHWTDLASPTFLPIPGYEITSRQPPEKDDAYESFGHHVALGVTRLVGPLSDEISNWDIYPYDAWDQVQQSLDEVHHLGGLFIPAHPVGSISDWGQLQDYDAIEIFNGGQVAPFLRSPDSMRTGRGRNGNTVATQCWFEFLNAGNRLPAVASSDCHDTTAVAGKNPKTARISDWRRTTGTPRTYVHSKQLTWPAVQSAIKKGNSFITAGHFGPLLLVESDGLGPGDEIRVRPGQSIPLRIRVLSNRPLKADPDAIRIILGGKVIQRLATEEGKMEMDLRATIPIDPDPDHPNRDTWLIVQAFGPYPAAAMTNPIYLNLPPHDPWGARQWSFPPTVDLWAAPKPAPPLPEITIPDGPFLPEGQEW